LDEPGHGFRVENQRPGEIPCGGGQREVIAAERKDGALKCEIWLGLQEVENGQDGEVAACRLFERRIGIRQSGEGIYSTGKTNLSGYIFQIGSESSFAVFDEPSRRIETILRSSWVLMFRRESVAHRDTQKA
jgi:hypothetical protein